MLRCYAVVGLHKFYCEGVADPMQMAEYFEGRIEATAELMLTSHIKCKANGKRALACASTFVDARSFALASFDVYRTAIAQSDVDSTCTCGQKLFADADASVAAWAQVLRSSGVAE